MKIAQNTLKLTFVAVAAALLTPLSAFARTKEPTEPARLQVRVETPAVVDIIRESDIADALAYRFQETFRRAGFKGRIAQVEDRDEASADSPLITLRLIDWRQGRTGFVDCSLVATVTHRDGTTQSLGAVNGTAVVMGHASRFTRADAFSDAADNAMRTVWNRYQKLTPPAVAPKATDAPAR